MELVDIVSFIIIIGFLLWGMKKGFIREISEIAGLIIAFLLSMYIPIKLNIGLWKYLVSFLIYFLILSIGFTILSRIVNKTPLALIDKMLGALVGMIKGLIIIIILFLIISVMPEPNNYKTLEGSVFYNITLGIKPVLKGFLQRKMTGLIPEKKQLLPNGRKGLYPPI